MVDQKINTRLAIKIFNICDTNLFIFLRLLSEARQFIRLNGTYSVILINIKTQQAKKENEAVQVPQQATRY